VSRRGIRVGYAKIGRNISFDPKDFGFQGDAEAPQLLYRLAARNPDVTWVIVGRNNRQKDFPFPNIENPWADRPTGPAHGFADKLAVQMGLFDGVVIHAGQTGTSHRAIPQSNSTWEQFYRDPDTHSTTPQDWAYIYAGFLIDGLNILGNNTDGRAPVVWLVTDPRNYLKARDVKWPTGCNRIAAQYQFVREQRHERFRDDRSPKSLGFDWCTPDRNGEIWVARHTYRYGGLELMIVPDDWQTWGPRGFDERQPAGVATTSFAIGEKPWRSDLVRDYLLAAHPRAEVWGRWDAGSLRSLDGTGTRLQTGKPSAFPDQLGSWRTTIAMKTAPSSLKSGSGWTAAKPVQCWAARVVCFMLGELDRQGWLLPSRLKTPESHEVAPGLYSVRDDWIANDLVLARWCRISKPEEFAKASHAASTSRETWEWLVGAQRDLLRRRWDDHYVERIIEYQLQLDVLRSNRVEGGTHGQVSYVQSGNGGHPGRPTGENAGLAANRLQGAGH
jgi:hypothetical protein